MDDYIRRQAAIDVLHVWFADGFSEDKWWNSTHVLAALEGIPSADVVKVVRCKDCKYWREYKYAKGVQQYIPRCGYHAIYTKAEDYCSYGERRNDD